MMKKNYSDCKEYLIQGRHCEGMLCTLRDSEKCSRQGEIRWNKYQFLLLDYYFFNTVSLPFPVLHNLWGSWRQH